MSMLGQPLKQPNRPGAKSELRGRWFGAGLLAAVLVLTGCQDDQRPGSPQRRTVQQPLGAQLGGPQNSSPEAAGQLAAQSASMQAADAAAQAASLATQYAAAEAAAQSAIEAANQATIMARQAAREATEMAQHATLIAQQAAGQVGGRSDSCPPVTMMEVQRASAKAANLAARAADTASREAMARAKAQSAIEVANQASLRSEQAARTALEMSYHANEATTQAAGGCASPSADTARPNGPILVPDDIARANMPSMHLSARCSPCEPVAEPCYDTDLFPGGRIPDPGRGLMPRSPSPVFSDLMPSGGCVEPRARGNVDGPMVARAAEGAELMSERRAARPRPRSELMAPSYSRGRAERPAARAERGAPEREQTAPVVRKVRDAQLLPPSHECVRPQQPVQSPCPPAEVAEPVAPGYGWYNDWCNWDCPSWLTPNMSIYLSHLEAKGIGFHHGYSTLGLFFTPELNGSPNVFPLLDGRFHAFNHGGLAANAGIGLRWLSECAESVFGINFFYDWRSKRHHHVNRGGVGLEWLGCRWDLRANGYFPLGHSHFVGKERHFHFPGGYHATCKEKIRALSGADLEVGFPLKRWDCCSTGLIYLAGGPYYYHGTHCHHRNIWGGQVRLQMQFLNYLIFQLKDSYDNRFHNNLQGVLTFKIPLGNQKEPPYRRGCGDCCTCDCLRPIAVQPIYRNEIPVFDRAGNEWHDNWGGLCGDDVNGESSN